MCARFIDTRNGYRRTSPESCWAKFFHKQRVWVFGDRVFATHTVFSQRPFVTLDTSTFAQDATLWRRQPWEFALGRRQRRECLEEDWSYFEMGCSQPELMRYAIRVLGFDFAAIDYSRFPDDSIILWEANPYPAYHPAEGFAAHEKRRMRNRDPTLFDAFAGFFRRLIEPA